MREILSDLVAEEQHLDQFLQGLSTREWKKKTPAPGWTIQDQVSHLAHLEGFAAEVIELWRHGRADVVEALSRMLATDRIPWICGEMSARSFATMRLMETWAHGIDIKVAILGRMTPIPEDDLEEDEEDPIADTPRLRHIAWLGQKSLPFAFEQAGETYPSQGIRVELMGPKYAAWRFGPEDTDQVIRGMAADWCRVVVRRQPASETGLKAVGASAERALEIARAY